MRHVMSAFTEAVLRRKPLAERHESRRTAAYHAHKPAKRKVLTWDETRRIAANIAKVPALIGTAAGRCDDPVPSRILRTFYQATAAPVCMTCGR